MPYRVALVPDPLTDPLEGKGMPHYTPWRNTWGEMIDDRDTGMAAGLRCAEYQQQTSSPPCFRNLTAEDILFSLEG